MMQLLTFPLFASKSAEPVHDSNPTIFFQLSFGELFVRLLPGPSDMPDSEGERQSEVILEDAEPEARCNPDQQPLGDLPEDVAADPLPRAEQAHQREEASLRLMCVGRDNFAHPDRALKVGQCSGHDACSHSLPERMPEPGTDKLAFWLAAMPAECLPAPATASRERPDIAPRPVIYGADFPAQPDPGDVGNMPLWEGVTASRKVKPDGTPAPLRHDGTPAAETEESNLNPLRSDGVRRDPGVTSGQRVDVMGDHRLSPPIPDNTHAEGENIEPAAGFVAMPSVAYSAASGWTELPAPEFAAWPWPERFLAGRAPASAPGEGGAVPDAAQTADRAQQGRNGSEMEMMVSPKGATVPEGEAPDVWLSLSPQIFRPVSSGSVLTEGNPPSGSQVPPDRLQADTARLAAPSALPQRPASNQEGPVPAAARLDRVSRGVDFSPGEVSDAVRRVTGAVTQNEAAITLPVGDAVVSPATASRVLPPAIPSPTSAVCPALAAAAPAMRAKGAALQLLDARGEADATATVATVTLGAAQPAQGFEEVLSSRSFLKTSRHSQQAEQQPLNSLLRAGFSGAVSETVEMRSPVGAASEGAEILADLRPATSSLQPPSLVSSSSARAAARSDLTEPQLLLKPVPIAEWQGTGEMAALDAVSLEGRAPIPTAPVGLTGREVHPLSAPGPGPSPPFISQIGQAAAGAAGPVTEVRLSPEELGLVRIELQTDGDKVSVTLMAERVETLDLLRRHADRLIAELRGAGFSQLELGFGTTANGREGPPPGASSAGCSEADPALPIETAELVFARALPTDPGSLYMRL